MPHAAFVACRAITQELLSNPLNVEFSRPFDPQEGQLDVTKSLVHPMDLGTVLTKLDQNAYPTPCDWYNDVCLVFENCRFYHPVNSLWHAIATYNLKEFKKMTRGFECRTTHEWYNTASQAMLKLQIEIAESPIPQGVDPMILSIVKKAHSLPPLFPQAIADVIERINIRVLEESKRYDILCLLKQMEPQLKLDEDKLTIDSDMLSDVTLVALSLYLKRHG
jgi:hypothetical protein